MTAPKKPQDGKPEAGAKPQAQKPQVGSLEDAAATLITTSAPLEITQETKIPDFDEAAAPTPIRHVPPRPQVPPGRGPHPPRPATSNAPPSVRSHPPSPPTLPRPQAASAPMKPVVLRKSEAEPSTDVPEAAPFTSPMVTPRMARPDDDDEDRVSITSSLESLDSIESLSITVPMANAPKHITDLGPGDGPPQTKPFGQTGNAPPQAAAFGQAANPPSQAVPAAPFSHPRVAPADGLAPPSVPGAAEPAASKRPKNVAAGNQVAVIPAWAILYLVVAVAAIAIGLLILHGQAQVLGHY